MINVVSNVERGKILHSVYRRHDIECLDSGGVFRRDICVPEDEIQIAALKLADQKTFVPHKHIKCKKTHNITQESWVVIRGRIEATYYDLDDSIICKHILAPGDLTVTFEGGHNYKSLEPDSLVYEFKTGPYLGKEKDKTPIGE